MPFLGGVGNYGVKCDRKESTDGVRTLREPPHNPKGGHMLRRTRQTKKLRRGDLHLLHDMAVLHVVMRGQRVPARRRLERKLGSDFAGSLIASLTTSNARAA